MPKWTTMRLMVADLLLSIILIFFPFQAEAKRYKFDCTYSQYASPEGPKNVDGFKLEFHFDDITGKAVLIGNSGVSDVDAHAGNLAVTFMKELNDGVVQTTTITNDGSSIHSRHSIVTDKIIPSQYYGRCLIE